MSKEYRLHENIAAISASVHADVRFTPHIESGRDTYAQRLAWCVHAAEALTLAEPEDYEQAGLDWCVVSDVVAEGFFVGLSPADAVRAALNP